MSNPEPKPIRPQDVKYIWVVPEARKGDQFSTAFFFGRLPKEKALLQKTWKKRPRYSFPIARLEEKEEFFFLGERPWDAELRYHLQRRHDLKIRGDVGYSILLELFTHKEIEEDSVRAESITEAHLLEVRRKEENPG